MHRRFKPLLRRPAILVALVCLVSAASATPTVCPTVPLSPFPVAGSQYDPVAHSRHIYVVGGWNNAGGAFDSVYIGTVSRNGTISWALSPNSLPEVDQGPSATIYNGWIYVVLGNGHVYRAQLMPDGSIGSWIDEGVGMAYRGGFMSAEAYDGRLYVLGGFGDGAGGCSTHSDVIVAPIDPADGSLGAWQSTTSMPEPRQHHSVHFHKGRAYIAAGITGCTGPILSSVFSAPVDSATGLLGTWRAEASLPQALWGHKSVLIGNEIVIFGGRTDYSGGGSTAIYRGTIDPSDGAITEWRTEPCTVPSDATNWPGAVYVDSLGLTVLIGGSSPSGGSGGVWRSPLPAECQTDGFWNTATPMPVVSDETSAVEVDGMIYVLGNNNGTSENNRLYRYDPNADTWQQLANMPTGRGQGAAAAVDGVIYYFGGNTAYGNDWTTTVEAYDIGQGNWTTKTSLPGDARGMLTAVALNGRIYVMGGVNSYTVPTYSYNHIYDPATDSWSSGAPLPRPRSHHGAALLNGKIYLIGGDYRYNHSDEWAVPEVDVYDPARDTWCVAPDSLMLRAECSVVTLNGRIYVLGGREKLPTGEFANNVLRRAEEFDPTTNCWSVVTSLPAPRYRGSAVACNNLIYFIGGYDGTAWTNTLFAGVPLPLRGDVDHDGDVDLTDLTLFLSQFGSWLQP